MSLLGYLIPRIASNGEESAATQALAYLLNASTDIAQAFVDVVGSIGNATFTPGRIAAEKQHGNHFPDLTIRDTAGVVRILVENKFWAGLTDAQPVAYLEALPRDALSALVFIVPHQRMYGLSGELRDKCTRNAAKRQQQHEQVPGHVDCRRRRRRRPGAGTPDRMLEHLAHRLPLQDQDLGQRTPRRSAPAQGA